MLAKASPATYQKLRYKFASGRGGEMPTRDSQDFPQSQEPSPTPASRTRGGVVNTQERESVRMLPPLNIPKPLPITLGRRLGWSTNSNAELIPARISTSEKIETADPLDFGIRRKALTSHHPRHH